MEARLFACMLRGHPFEGEVGMSKLNLQAKARELARVAQSASSGRAAHTIVGGHERRLRQTVVALRAGSTFGGRSQSEFGESTLLVISGQLWLAGSGTEWYGREWSHLVIPDAPYEVRAKTDATFLLSVAMSRTPLITPDANPDLIDEAAAQPADLKEDATTV